MNPFFIVFIYGYAKSYGYAILNSSTVRKY